MVFFFFYGASDLDRKNPPTAAVAKKDKPAGANIRDAIRSSTFVRMAIACLLIMIVVTAGVVHFIPIVSAGGLPRSEAVTLVSVIGVSAFAGRLVTGSLLDRTNATLVGGIAFMLPALAYLGLAFFDGQITTAIAIAILFGFCSGAELEVASYLSSRIFGMRNFGALFGLIVGLITLGAGMGPPLAGFVYDQFGTYDIALWSAAGMSIVAGLLILSLGSCKPMSATEAAAAGTGH